MRWSTWPDATVTVTATRAATAAQRQATRWTHAVGKASSSHRGNAEVHRVYGAGGRALKVSPLLAALVDDALMVATRTGGALDPTVDPAVRALAHQTDHTLVPVCASIGPARPRPASGFRGVQLRGRQLQVPAYASLDLSMTNGAWLVDRCAAQIAEHQRVGVLVQLGTQLATAGHAPSEGAWRVTLHDGGMVLLPSGCAAATSYAARLVDPATGRRLRTHWSSVTVVGRTALEAKAWGGGALVLPADCVQRLEAHRVAARLVRDDGVVVSTDEWRRVLGDTAAPAGPAQAAHTAPAARTLNLSA